MAAERWIFTKSQLQNTPSRKSGIDSDKELSYRQQAANLIQDMGQRLQVTQLCINTAIVYMHRFYMFHSFTRFHRNPMSAASLFLAAKVEEQPRKLEHVIRCAHSCLNREAPPLDTQSNAYFEQAHELVINENILLQTLGFDLSIDHPHTNVVKTCQLVRAPRDLAQTSYFLATNSLHLTALCLQYKPTVVACVCVHLACKWSKWEIPIGREGKEWYYYVDKSVTKELLEELTTEFLTILDRCPNKLRKKIMTWKSGKDPDALMMADRPIEKRSKTEPSSAAGSAEQEVSIHRPSSSSAKHTTKEAHPSQTSHQSHGSEKSRKEHAQIIKQEKPTSSSTKPKESSVVAENRHVAVSGSSAPASQRQNVFDALTSEAFVKEEKPDLNVNVSIAVPPALQSVPSVSLAEYKERRERERALTKSHSSDSALKANIKAEPDVLSEASDKEKEKLRKSHSSSHHHRHHHSKHGAGSEGSSSSDHKIRIKTEPSTSASSSSQQVDPKLKLPSLPTSAELVQDLLKESLSKNSPSTALSVTPSVKTEVNVTESKHRKEALLSSNKQPSMPDPKLVIKSEPSSPQVPSISKPEVKLKIKTHHSETGITQPGASPLKLKIKTSHLPKEAQFSDKNGHKEQKVPALKLSSHPSRMKSSDSTSSSSSSSSSKHPHKSHKSSKSSHSSSSLSKGTNGKEDIKIHISLSDIQKQSSSSDPEKKISEKHHRHAEKSRKERTTSQQDALVRSKSDVNSRKRPLMSPGEVPSNDLSSHSKSKIQKSTESQMRRSSSSHSVVSMDMSSDSGSVAGNDMDNHISAHSIMQNIQRAIEQKKRNIAESQSQKSSPVLQQNFPMSQPQYHNTPFAQLFQAAPPQPPPPPPPDPPSDPPPPPPPPPQDTYSYSNSYSNSSQPFAYQELGDIDFLEDDPPLPDEIPPVAPPPPPSNRY
ncbi:hypothetical protein FSP39_016569 [Pinctada imbricata]|uniref:Cyclin-like domain-containing protein n=1 Tax=Pinctada imbricata TaxID=66713 RepID=A0AA88YV26_PINIB|nr:hypothetical protein FSP39_016569 [Pinctada imbricata]